MLLHSHRTGTGPPLLALHGLFGSHENLGVIARRLADRFSIVSMDLRNHGRSPHGSAMDLPTLAADVAETMDAQGIEAASILGHSLGGKVAMELALNAGERVRALVVLDIAPVAYGHQHDDELAAMRRLDPAQLGSRAGADRALAEAIPSAGVRQFLLKNLVRGDDGFAWRIPLDTIAGQYREIAAAPSAGHYEGPALFLRGGASDYVQAAQEAAVHERFPRARIETVPDTAHWLHVEAPDAVAARIGAFLEE